MSNEVDELFGAAADDAAATAPSELLEWLQQKVKAVQELEARIDRGQALLKDLGEKLRFMLETEIPNKFLDNQITDMKIGNVVVKIQKFYNAKIPDGREDEAFAWLEQTKNDEIIKSEVKATFGKGEDEKAKRERAVEALIEADVQFSEKRGVHPQTLKSFVKNAIESGENIPVELFGVYVGNRAKLSTK